ncbi:threonine ammonia-lyase [Kineosporia rhizophila]|uniref:threonine ammonia-lyase n=1 Tax=Kineosporia TaxID=49184 RepID=UPI001E604782|nr:MULTISPECIES: threonine ammonia-lyase [Kineosporia]MCE0540072.1 threonine ammonia-lyase [Kineosporia rhizophila]GLY19194.1 threonine ammonia-lyase [Kineosporia sp. NBRC 101677]
MSAPARVLPVSDADVLAAAELLEPVIRRTPVVRSRALSDLRGGDVYLKCENQQRAGSFKIRGAYTRMARLSEAEKARGVVAASAGNHAQGVALAARLLGVPARVYMPVGAPLPKLDATRGYGAEVVLTGSTVDECLASALEHAETSGAVMIHPFDHADVVAGQGTIALEFLEQRPDVKTVLVSTGGGGLLAGVATVLKARRPDIRVIGVQAESAAAYPPSLAAGRPESLPSMSTMADGIAVGRPGDVPFAIVDSLVDEVVTVDEETISRALLLMLERQKLLIEPAGAVAVAALLKDGLEIETPALAVLSGGNVDPLLLMRLIRHGLASAGRYLRLRVRVPDTPGSLAQLLMRLATTDANVMEVEHVRTGARTAVNEVEVALWVETRGPAHCDQVVADLTAAGYQPRHESD